MKTKKIKVVLTAYVQTSYEDYTHLFKTVEIEIPDDGEHWHVVGEMLTDEVVCGEMGKKEE